MPLFSLFRGAAHISFIVCTGTHTAETQENRAILDKILKQIRRIGLFSYDAVLHDCRIAQFADAGKTAFGTPILYNKLLNKADIFLTLNDVRFHYFAGYSNPVKNFVPGVCAFETAEKNHSLTFDPRSRYGAHPWHPRADRRDHPLAADLLEAMNQIVRSRPVWSLVTLSDKGKLWACFGPAKRPSLSRPINAPNISSSPQMHDCFPADIRTELYIVAGADVQCPRRRRRNTVSGCRPNGIGGRHTIENFYNKWQPLILSSENLQYKLYSHKLPFAQLIRRLRFFISIRSWMIVSSAPSMRPTVIRRPSSTAGLTKTPRKDPLVDGVTNWPCTRNLIHGLP